MLDDTRATPDAAQPMLPKEGKETFPDYCSCRYVAFNQELCNGTLGLREGTAKTFYAGCKA